MISKQIIDDPVQALADVLEIVEKRLATLEVLTREALKLSDDRLHMKVEEIARVLNIPEREWYAMSSNESRNA